MSLVSSHIMTQKSYDRREGGLLVCTTSGLQKTLEVRTRSLKVLTYVALLVAEMSLSYLPGTASLLEELDKKLMVLLRDGRTLIGDKLASIRGCS